MSLSASSRYGKVITDHSHEQGSQHGTALLQAGVGVDFNEQHFEIVGDHEIETENLEAMLSFEGVHTSVTGLHGKLDLPLHLRDDVLVEVI